MLARFLLMFSTVAMVLGLFQGNVLANTELVTHENEVEVNVLSGEKEDAVGSNPSEVVKGLFLQVPQVEDFETIRITADEKQVVYTNFVDSGRVEDSFLVEDLRGTHEGWKLSVSATPFEADGGITLPEGSFLFAGVDKAIPVDDKSIGNEKDLKGLLTDYTVIDRGNIDILVANEGEGVGSYQVLMNDLKGDFSLVVDSLNVLAGEYRSVITWTLHDTPLGN